MTEIVLAWLHYMAIIGTASVLVAEHLLLKPGLDAAGVRRLARIDGLYGALAAVLLVTGGLRFWLGAKGMAYYLANPVFHAKVGLFVLIGLLSIWPTVRYLRWSRAAKADPRFTLAAAQIGGVTHVLRLQLLLLVVVVPLLAAAMARGVTRFGQLFG